MKRSVIVVSSPGELQLLHQAGWSHPHDISPAVRVPGKTSAHLHGPPALQSEGRLPQGQKQPPTLLVYWDNFSTVRSVSCIFRADVVPADENWTGLAVNHHETPDRSFAQHSYMLSVYLYSTEKKDIETQPGFEPGSSECRCMIPSSLGLQQEVPRY